MKLSLRASWRWLLARRWLGHPLLAAAMFAAGGLDLYWVADHNEWTPAGRVLRSARGAEGPFPGGRDLMCYVCDGARGMHVWNCCGPQSDELIRLEKEGSNLLYYVNSTYEYVCVGLIAPWWERGSARLITGRRDDSPAPARVKAFARTDPNVAIIMTLPKYNVCYESDADPLTLDSFLWNLRAWGIAHDAVMVPLDLLALLGIVRIPAYLRRRRHEARQARSLCTKCRYPVAGLPSDAGVCPECGQRIENSGPILAPA